MTRRPFTRILWLPKFGFGAGRGDCYGWRWWIGFGPGALLLGRAKL